MLEIRTLGELSFRVNGRTLGNMGSHKAEAMLIYLLLEGGQHSRSKLETLFWPESSQEHASTSLRVALSVLRRKLAGYLDTSRDAVAIKPGAKVALDVLELERELEGGETEAALQLYRDGFLPGFHVRASSDFEDWLQAQQERLRELMAAALHRSIEKATEAAEFTQGRRLVNRLLELDPLDERAHYHSILLHALSGERTAALAQYEKCCEILRSGLGVEPSEELAMLHERIQRGEQRAHLMPALPEHNLPAPQTSFVGREKELARIGALIRDPACRLLTLVGPGGCGKTRLALQAAAESLRSFPDGSYFVPLEAGSSGDYLVSAILRVLPFSVDSFINPEPPRAQLLNYVRKRSMLLVLDGCEQLSGRVGDLPAILENAPHLTVLATSRQRLGLQSERIFAIEGLRLPRSTEEARSSAAEAVRLFRDRSETAGTDSQLSEPDHESILRICRLVDGMPLGIELAAAWTPVLSLPEIAEEAGKSFDFLITTMGDVPKAHRSMRAVFDSSWSLLSDDLRGSFSKLSVFDGPFDRRAAEQVAGADLQQLSALVSRSLLGRNDAGVFTMHGLVRQFAAEKLGQRPEMQMETEDRFSRYYVDLLAQQEADLQGTKMLAARGEIRRSIDNVRAAVEVAALHWEQRSARKVLRSLMWFYLIQGWQEGAIAYQEIAERRRDALIRSSTSAPDDDPIVLSARIHQAFIQCNLGQIADSEAISRACLEGLRQPGLESELSECLQNLGVNASSRGEYEDAKEFLERAILLGRESENALWPTYLIWRGNLDFLIGEYEQGLATLQKCHELFDRWGTLWGTAFTLSKMGMAVDGLGEHARARKYHQEALSVFDELESKAGRAYALSRMSMSAYFLEEYPEAERLAQEGHAIFEKIGHRWGICTSLCALGFASIGLGDVPRARAFFESALKESRPEQIVPQSLYALVGLASCLALEGKEERAHELVRYVRRHPQIPSIYLEQGARWIRNMDHTSRPSPDEETATIEEVIGRHLD
jgi:predicted ATPase/DNA-binding SARP family transcriptional activator